MTSLVDLGSMLQDTHAAMAQLERAFAQSPESDSLRAIATSLGRRREALERQFDAAAEALGVDVCSYRLFPEDGDQPQAAAVGRALDSFQSLVSVVYNAVASGVPKRGGRLPAEVVAQTSFGFAYSFPGSVGFVLTLPNERLLIGDSKLDESMSVIFEMAKAESPDDVAAYAERFGPAPVRAMYRWTKNQVSSALGADIQWRRGDEVRASLFLQLPELDHLQATIEATSDATSESVTFSAMLVGLDIDKGRFHLVLDGNSHIQGTLSEVAARGEPATVPARYTAHLTKVSRTQYSTDSDEVVWVLDGLEPV